ncbi:hypothetical protein D3C76_877700 [compost metagenome]
MLAMAPCCWPGCNNSELITGDRVSATMPDTITAPARVRANSRNSVPVSPPIKPIGAYTAARVRVMAITGPAISRAPASAAATGDLPSSIWRCTFSTTTMASSTTRPMASTIASKVSRFRLKPNSSIRPAAPSIDSGMATTAITTLRSEPRHSQMTSTTISMASTRVRSTSSIEASMKRAVS